MVRLPWPLQLKLSEGSLQKWREVKARELRPQSLSPPPLSRVNHNHRSSPLLQMKANHMDRNCIKGGSTRRKQEMEEAEETKQMTM